MLAGGLKEGNDVFGWDVGLQVVGRAQDVAAALK
jgi:hypothetical protein